MTTSVLHTAPPRATVDNDSVLATGYVSCTQILRHAHHMSGGDIAQAIDILGGLRNQYTSASSGIRVLRSRVSKMPDADVFTVEHSGFVSVAKRPREIFTLVLGDLRFERSGDSMAVFRYDERLERIALPAATEFAFFRAAHDYAAAVAAPAEVA